MKDRILTQVGFRIERDTYTMVRKVARARGEDVSDFVRRAIKRELARLKYLSKEDERALGMWTEKPDNKSGQEVLRKWLKTKI